MQNTTFTLMATSPLVDTASGVGRGLFDEDFSKSLKAKNIELEINLTTAKDNDKVNQLKGDILADEYKFSVPKSLISSLCEDIADEVFRKKEPSKDFARQTNRQINILVEGEKGSSVISVLDLSAQEIGEAIKQIVT